MNIAIVFNTATRAMSGDTEELASDREMRIIPSLVESELNQRGFATSLVEADINVGRNCLNANTQIALNLAEGFSSTNGFEHLVPLLLDWENVPYTGADAANMLILRNKHITSRCMSALGVECPEAQVIQFGDERFRPEIKFPIILKPITEEASHGIYLDSVVVDTPSFERKLLQLFDRFGTDVVAERYIIGREISVGAWGNKYIETLPAVEFFFPGAEALAAFRSFEYKWLGKQEDMRRAFLSEETSRRLAEITILAHKTFGCRDYSRADYRISEDGKIYFLEHNFNPGIGPNTYGLSNTFTRMAEYDDYSYGQMLEKLINIARSRYKQLQR